MDKGINTGIVEISDSAKYALQQACVELEDLLADFSTGNVWKNSLERWNAKLLQVRGKPVSATITLNSRAELRIVTVINATGQTITLIGKTNEHHINGYVVFTEAEYESYPDDYKSTWSTEREDMDDWETFRPLVMGKRTLLTKYSLNIEGLTLFII